MKTGIIGLGAMGLPMALNLHQAGQLHQAWNRSPQPARELHGQTGVRIADDPGSLAAACDLIFICVSGDGDLLEVCERILPGIRPDTVVVDTSTVSSDTAREMASRLQAKQAWFLDAPVSGGVEGARNASLAMMVGGPAEVLERITPVLSSIAARITHMGAVGAGQATKAVNQIMVAGINQAVTDALAFAQVMGLPMDKVIEVTGSGAAGNWFLNHRGGSMVAGSFEPGFRLALHHKDLAICREMQELAGMPPLETVESTLRDYVQLMEQGFGNEDISALFRLKRRA